MAAIQVASLFGVLNLQDNMTPGLKSADRQAQSFGSRIQQIGGSVQSFGAKMTATMAPVGAALGLAVNSSRTFSRTMSNVNAILGISGQEAADLRATLLAYGGNTVAGPQRVAEAYYDIVSGVADASTHMAILDAATRTSEAGQADLKATTSALISTMNAYKLGAEDAAFVSDVFSRTVQTGVLTMDEMASAFPQVTGLASQFGLGVDDMAGSLAYLTTQGFSASQSATFMKGMITTLLNPTTQLAGTITSLGYESGQAMLEAEGLVGAYSLLSEANGGLAGLITNQEALTGSMVLTGDAAGTFLTNFTTGITGATEAARGIQSETAGWDLFTSKIQQLAITTGDRLAPVLLDLMENKIVPLINTVIGWAEANPQLFGSLVMITGALVVAGPIIAGVGTIISAVGTVASLLTSGFTLLTGASGILTGALGLLLSPISLLIAIGAGVAFLFTRPGGISGAFQEATTNAIALGEQLGVIVSRLAEIASQNAQGLGSQLGQIFGGGHSAGDIWAATTHALGIGGNAGGGMVKAGDTRWIGERGPELVTFNSSATVHNNPSSMAMAGAGGGDTFNFGNIITPDPEDFMRQIEERRRRRR